MKLLMLGGTAFLGRHLVEAALGRGHEELGGQSRQVAVLRKRLGNDAMQP